MQFFVTMALGSPLAMGYITFEGFSEDEVREICKEWLGRSWAFTYTEKEFEGQPEKYNLYEICRNVKR